MIKGIQILKIRIYHYQHIKIISTLLLSLMLSTRTCADIYIYIDSKGSQHFAAKKIDENYQLLLRSESNESSGSFRNWKEKKYINIKAPNNKNLQKKYHSLIVQAANKYQLEPAFIHAVIAAESSYQRTAVSSAGAKGLMQLMPVTARRFAVNDPFDAQQSIFAGTKYLHTLLKEFKSKKIALAAYNAGEGTVRRYNKKIPPYPETQKYVNKVMDFYWYYKDNL